MDGDLMGNYSDSMFMHNVRSNENKKHQLKKSVHVFLNSLLQAIFPGPCHEEPIFVYFRPFAHALLGLQLLLVFLHQK